MAGRVRTLLGFLAVGLVLAAGGCGHSPDEGIPNPALGPPPVIKSERGTQTVPAPPKKSRRVAARN